MNWYLKALKEHYADFKGRARRKEYWMFVLFQSIFVIVAIILDSILGLSFTPEIPYGWIYILFGLLTFIPSLSIAVRRLHDVGKSGWWYLIVFVPLIGPIWLLVLFCSDSENKPNQWGDNPKGIGNDDAINKIGSE